MFTGHTDIDKVTEETYILSVVQYGWGYVFNSASDYIHEKYLNRVIDTICNIFDIQTTDCRVSCFDEVELGFTFTGSKRNLKEFEYALMNKSHPANEIIQDIWLEYQDESKQINWIDEINAWMSPKPPRIADEIRVWK